MHHTQGQHQHHRVWPLELSALIISAPWHPPFETLSQTYFLLWWEGWRVKIVNVLPSSTSVELPLYWVDSEWTGRLHIKCESVSQCGEHRVYLLSPTVNKHMDSTLWGANLELFDYGPRRKVLNFGKEHVSPGRIATSPFQKLFGSKRLLMVAFLPVTSWQCQSITGPLVYVAESLWLQCHLWLQMCITNWIFQYSRG